MDDNGVIGVDDLEDEDEMDGDHLDYESTDSMTSANQLSSGYILTNKKDPVEARNSYLIKRSSTTSNAVYYNARPCLSHQNSQQVGIDAVNWSMMIQSMRLSKERLSL